MALCVAAKSVAAKSERFLEQLSFKSCLDSHYPAINDVRMGPIVDDARDICLIRRGNDAADNNLVQLFRHKQDTCQQRPRRGDSQLCGAKFAGLSARPKKRRA